MPITGTFTLEELIAELLKQDQSALITGLQTHAKPLFQSIFDKGHSTATAKWVGDKSDLEGQVNGLKEQLKQKDDQLKAIGDKAPDVAALTAKHAEDIRRLEDKYKGELKVVHETLVGERVSRAAADLKLELTGMGVDAEYADVVVDKAQKQNRLRPNAKGSVEFFRADTDAPFVASNGEEPVKLLAKELRATVPAKFVTANGDSGSGTSTAPSGGAKGKEKFQAIRDDVKKKEAANASTDTAASRLQGTTRKQTATA